MPAIRRTGPSSRRRGSVRSWLVGMAVVITVAGGGWGWLRLPTALDYWHEELLASSEDDLPGIVAELATRGDTGVRILAAELGSTRTMVRELAHSQLLEQVRLARRLPTELGEPRYAVIAAALAESLSQYDADARRHAANLVEELLLGRHVTTGARRAELAKHCHRVLAAVDDDIEAAGELRPESSTRRERALQNPQVLRLPAAVQADEAALKELPPLPQPNAKVAAAAPMSEPVPLLDDASANPLRSEQMQDARPTGAVAVAIAPSWTKSPLVKPAVATTRSPDAASTTATGFERLATIELFQRLQADDPQKRQSAEAEVQRRKFTPRQIELGLGVTARESSVRREWVERLPGLSGIEALPWLLWLSDDPEPSVRRAAITLLATSDSPQARSRVMRAAREDSDERVQQQATRAVYQPERNPRSR